MGIAHMDPTDMIAFRRPRWEAEGWKSSPKGRSQLHDQSLRFLGMIFSESFGGFVRTLLNLQLSQFLTVCNPFIIDPSNPLVAETIITVANRK
jgi:hypothetical protein